MDGKAVSLPLDFARRTAAANSPLCPTSIRKPL